MKTYLELVNEAIAEAKVTLDPLTSANFANPPRTLLYNRFKTWVNRAYKELLLRRPEWQFRVERANVTVWPRLHLTAVTTLPVVGDILEGVSSGVQAVVKSVHTYEDIEDDSITEVTVGLDILDNKTLYDFILTEDLNRILPTAAASVATVKGMGSYNLKDEVVNCSSIDEHSIRLYDATGNLRQWSTTLEVIPWQSWIDGDQVWAHHTGHPECVTVAPDGNLEFYPRLDRNYIVQFIFSKKVPELVLYNDVPSLIPEEYQDYLLWKALADYADWDSNQRVFARASKNLENYLYWLERDEIEDPRMGPNIFYRSY